MGRQKGGTATGGEGWAVKKAVDGRKIERKVGKGMHAKGGDKWKEGEERMVQERK